MKSHLDYWSPNLQLNVTDYQKDMVKQDIRQHFWAWYREHENDVIFRFLWWKWTVKDVLYELFVRLFGAPETA